jgi:hypothetical protein
MDTIEIRDFSLGEADSVAAFFHERWRPDHVFYLNRQLLLWQYCDNPYASRFSEGLTFRGAFENGRPVGVFGYMPFCFNAYGRRSHGCHLSAWWVDPSHRRGPLGLQLLHSLQQNSPFEACIAGINTPTAERLYDRMGWVTVPVIPRLVYVVSRPRLFKLLQAGKAATQELSDLVGPATALANIDTGIEIHPLESFADLAGTGWDDFYWSEIAPSHMGPAREAAYLMWRYGRIPAFRYHALLARRGKQIEGLLVYRIEKVRDMDERIVRVVDIAAHPGATLALANAAMQAAAEADAALLDFFCTDSKCMDLFKQCGFMSACREDASGYWIPHLFQPVDHARDRLNTSWWVRNMNLKTSAARTDFRIMKGDYEFDRPN